MPRPLATLLGLLAVLVVAMATSRPLWLEALFRWEWSISRSIRAERIVARGFGQVLGCVTQELIIRLPLIVSIDADVMWMSRGSRAPDCEAEPGGLVLLLLS